MVAKLSAAAVLAAGSSAFINTVGAVASSTTRATRKQRDTQALLKSARRYNNNKNKQSSSSPHPPRHLDGNNAFDGSYSIKFSQCIDIKLLDEDLFDEDVVEYTTEGQIISTASYALFHVCQTGQECYYESQDDLYIVDLSTYIQNMALYHANAKTSYCDACDTYYGDYCVDAAKQGYDDAYAQYQNQVQNYGDDGVEEEEENMGDDWQSRYNQYVDDNNNNRRLLLEEDVPFFGAGGRGSRSRRATSYIDCDTCEAYGCGANDDDNNRRRLDEGDNDVSELISDIAGCLNTGLEWNGNAMYVGFMCSPYSGDGVELAIFLDNKCTVYTTMKAFSDIPSYYIYSGEDMFTQAEGYIKQAFNSDTSMSCLVEEYDDPANAPGDDDVAQAQANANVDYDEVNDYCANIFDMGPVALNSCASAANDDQANNYDDANNQVDDAGQQYDDIVQWVREFALFPQYSFGFVVLFYKCSIFLMQTNFFLDHSQLYTV